MVEISVLGKWTFLGDREILLGKPSEYEVVIAKENTSLYMIEDEVLKKIFKFNKMF